MNLIPLLLNLLALAMVIGSILTIIDAISKKNFKIFWVIINPFYIFYYLLKLPDNNKKKILVILNIGTFWLFFILLILKVILTPPI